MHPRGALIARLDDVTAISVHLGLESAERARHVPQLLEIIGDVEQARVLGGDLNTRPEDASPARIAASHPDVWTGVGEGGGSTYPSSDATARIDYLFAGPRVQPLRAWTVGGTVSDHLMVVADLRINEA